LGISRGGSRRSGGIFDYAEKKDRLVEVLRELEDPAVWNEPERAQTLGRERAALEAVVNGLDEIESGVIEAEDLLGWRLEEGDADTVDAVAEDLAGLRGPGRRARVRRMFSGEMDAKNAFLDGQSGPGEPEAQDWPKCCCACTCAGRAAGFQDGAVSRSHQPRWPGSRVPPSALRATYAFGCCAPRPGSTPGAQVPLRLGQPAPHIVCGCVRLPGDRRPRLEIDINPADLRIDVYRASGAGGQHVNRTGVGGTHHPPAHRVVTQCQNDRSQHKNKATAMKQLQAKLYELEMQKRNDRQQAVEDTKSDIGWGAQIRSYVLDSRASSTCARGWRSPTPRGCSTATWTPSSRRA